MVYVVSAAPTTHTIFTAILQPKGETGMTQDEHDSEEVFHPKGAAVVLAIFILTIIVLWGSVYLILLAQGKTV